MMTNDCPDILADTEMTNYDKKYPNFINDLKQVRKWMWKKEIKNV